MATFTGQAATNNVFTGTAGADLFLWAAGNINDLDRASGAGGRDVLRFTTAGALATTALAGVTGIERIVLAADGNALTLINANLAGVAGARIVVTGGAGADTVNAAALTGANAVDVTAGAGNDRLTGGAGRDVFRFAAGNLAGDTVAGGGGRDQLLLTASGALGAGGLNNVSGVERLVLSAGGNTLALVNGNFAGVAGAVILVSGGAGADSVNGSALTGANRIDVTAGAGADVLRGGAGRDLFRFTEGNLTSADTVNGGAGLDQLLLTGSGALATTALNGVSGVETIQLASGGNGITLANANFAGTAGARIIVRGGAGNDTVNGAALTGLNRIDVTAGAGTDVLRGGAGRDVFRFRAFDLNGDTVQGGAGIDTVLLTSSSQAAFNGVSGVETIRLSSAGNNIVLLNANFANVTGSKIVVIGGAGDDNVRAFGLSSTNALDITAGGGTDNLRGSAGADVFRFRRSDLTSADTVTGGAGRDTLMLTTAGTITQTQLAGVTEVETIRLASGVNAITLGNANVADGGSISVIGGGGNGGSDTVDGSALTGVRSIVVTAGAGLDVLTGSVRDDLFLFRADDLAGDSVEGGGGLDTLQLTTAGTITADELALVSGVEQIRLANGTNAITLGNANMAADSSITVIGGSGNDTVDGSGLTDGRKVDITAGGGNDVLRGGAYAAVFRFAAADLTAGDTVQGGGGRDKLVFLSAGDVTAAELANVSGIDAISLAAGGNSLKLTDANYAGTVGRISIEGTAGASSIDGSALTGTNSLVFLDGGGADTIKGGAGDDFLDLGSGGRVFVAGDTFDGGGGVDTIFISQSMSFLGNTLRNVERLFNTGSAAVNVLISGASAAGLRRVGSQLNNGVNDIFTVQLSTGSTTDLSKLTLINVDAADAINVVSTGGAGTSTSVTLSADIARFTGSAGNDTVGLAPGRGYKSGAVIDGGEGDDRIAIDRSGISDAQISGGAGDDTLVLISSGDINLNLENQYFNDSGAIVANFENVDASALIVGISLTGRDDLRSILIGSSGADGITAGAFGAAITGGLGPDALTGGIGDDRFIVRSADEATGDTFTGGGGIDSIDVQADADLRGAAFISDIDSLVLTAFNAEGTISGAPLTATISSAQALSFDSVLGDSQFISAETLVIASGGGSVNLSTMFLGFWGSEDRVVIEGTSGNDTITGTAQNDEIDGGEGFDTLSGGGGNDTIRYGAGRAAALDGGFGTDTLSFSGNFNNAAEIAVDLAAGTVLEQYGADQGFAFFDFVATNFENADFSRNTFTTTLSGTGAANTLIGGSAADTITGGLGADTLTGGGGADRFVWNDKIEGGDTITDFTRGTDKLVFEDLGFTFSGSAFDQVTFDSGSGTLNLNNTDLLIAGQPLNDAAEVRAYVNNNSTSTQHGMFVVATSTSGSRVLYYTSNASASGADNTFFQIADLGEGVAPQLSDFVFV